ncbi:copper chaperone PCu(A)C [Rhodoblastus sp.]|uniref:copper chaperone PCu(A)C n=1 Tax=Rhodoblastus sp. TaxID=1962975 RepID=UPI0026329DC3|nr:copper chaperone PCu(A)C [Rhodoblastus sp.]
MRYLKMTTRAVVAGVALFAAGAAWAADIEIVAPWSRATAQGATVGVGYLTIVNKGSAPDRLKSITADVATSVELHEMAMDNSVMKMRALPEGLEIKPGATVPLKPGGYHLMLMGLKQPLVQGGAVHVTLDFAKAGPITVTMPIEKLGATGPSPSGDSEPPPMGY